MRGVTLPELLMVLVLTLIAAAILVPPAARFVDTAIALGSARRYVALHEGARQLALSRGQSVRLELDTATARATLTVRRDTLWDTIGVYALGESGVSASQTVVTFGPMGVGAGASNTRLVFTRGAAAETLTVSRTGRVKRF